MRLLALDIATCSGWAVDPPGGGDRPLSGSFRAPSDGENYGRPFVAFTDWLDGMIQVHQPDIVAFEAPLVVGGRNGTTRPTNAHTVRLLFGLASMAEMVAERRSVDSFECHIQTVRKHFVGSGRADKREVMQRCRVFGWAPVDDNAADACAIWSFAKATLESAAVRARAVARASA
jgi:Holliday junction resolvasome RuvABC endonuclease subunit